MRCSRRLPATSSGWRTRSASSSGRAKTPERFSRWDEQFHLRVAEASHNPLFLSIYRRINHVRSHRQWNAVKGNILRPERIAQYNAHHRKLYDAIRSRDLEAAVALIAEHLAEAERDLVAQ